MIVSTTRGVFSNPLLQSLEEGAMVNVSTCAFEDFKHFLDFGPGRGF